MKSPGQHIDVLKKKNQQNKIKIKKIHVERGTRASKMHSLPFSTPTHNNLVLLQVTSFWYPGVQGKHLSVGQLASQRAYLAWSDLPYTPGKCWWDTHRRSSGGSKLSLLWLSFLNRSVPLLRDGLPPPPPRAFLSTPCCAVWLCSQDDIADTKNLWVPFPANQFVWRMIYFQTLQTHCWCQHFMKIGLIILAGNCTWG